MAENGKKGTLIGLIFKVLIVLAIGACIGYFVAVNYSIAPSDEIAVVENTTEPEEVIATGGEKNVTASGIKFDLVQGKISNFDLSYLKIENKKENKIYSPLSIKYTLKMLEEGAGGNSRKQIADVTGDNKKKTYTNSKNLALANAFFIRDTYQDAVKDGFINLLKTKYKAEVNFDSFKDATAINKFVKENTLELIPEITDDDTVQELNFALVNALGIDMQWNEKFLTGLEEDDTFHSTTFSHLLVPKDMRTEENHFGYINVMSEEALERGEFNLESGENKYVSGMDIKAVICNYDVVNEIGKENIKNTITKEFTNYMKGEPFDEEHAFPGYEEQMNSDEEINKYLTEEYLPAYFDAIEKNYHNLDFTTEFSVYDDEDVVAFGKDLKEYDGTQLEYVGIMPKKENIADFVKGITPEKMNEYVEGLKSVDDYKNFEEGYVTIIEGYIPKFEFEYELDLMEDLKEQNITDVFESGKADLSNMVDDKTAFIGTAVHKANIEFTEDGIKAAAATMAGGLGAGDPFEYFYEVPVKKIDVTFDNPYMFIIRDKDTGDVWFTGTVYEPLGNDEDNSPNKIFSY